MPAQEPQTNHHSSNGPSNTHTWLLPDGRHLEVEPGKPLVHRMCVTCNRNFVHDLKLPLFLVVGVRSYRAHQAGRSRDTCPVFVEPIVQAWRIPYVLLDPAVQPIDDLIAECERAWAEKRAGIALLVE